MSNYPFAKSIMFIMRVSKLDLLQKEKQSTSLTPIQNCLCSPMFIAAQFTIAKYWKQPDCLSANEWIQKLWYIYTIEFYAAGRKKELLPFADIMDGTGEHYAK